MNNREAWMWMVVLFGVMACSAPRRSDAQTHDLVFSWVNNSTAPNLADGFVLQRLLPDGTWADVATIPATPDADPTTTQREQVFTLRDVPNGRQSHVVRSFNSKGRSAPSNIAVTEYPEPPNDVPAVPGSFVGTVVQP